MILNDKQILELSMRGMIFPCHHELCRKVELDDNRLLKAISYGVSSYGYDIRLSPKDFRVFKKIPGRLIDPKDFREDNLEPMKLNVCEETGAQYFILPAHSYGLGVAIERLKLPENVTSICLGKSTYARVGVIVNMTPAEAGWQGHLTLEFSNSCSSDVMIYANEGIAQLLFFEGEPCEVSYQTRNGKYQYQKQEVTLARL